MTFRDAKVLGYTIRIVRQYMNGMAGWSFELTFVGRLVAEGWTVGFGPRAKTQAMRDALEAVSAREALRACMANRVGA